MVTIYIYTSQMTFSFEIYWPTFVYLFPPIHITCFFPSLLLDFVAVTVLVRQYKFKKKSYVIFFLKLIELLDIKLYYKAMFELILHILQIWSVQQQ
jgi:hypothetical protein